LLLGNRGQPSKLDLNNGSGLFTNGSSHLPGAAISATAVAWIDVDLDQDLDIYLAGDSVQKLYLNDGNGYFVDASSQIPHVLGWALRVVATDFDQDGRSDLALGASGFNAPGSVSYVSLFENDGSGHFSDVSDRISRPNDLSAVAVLRRRRRDGHLDLVESDLGETNVLRWRNGSYLTLEDCTRPDFGAAQCADLDADGDADMIGYDGIAAFNRTRHVAWREVPRIGVPFHLDLSGPPRERFVLVGSRDAAQVPFGQLGVLASRAMRSCASSTGRSTSKGTPRSASTCRPTRRWSEADFYWQAVVGSPARLTNVEVTRFTDW
jgi:hypothetical protein